VRPLKILPDFDITQASGRTRADAGSGISYHAKAQWDAEAHIRSPFPTVHIWGYESNRSMCTKRSQLNVAGISPTAGHAMRPPHLSKTAGFTGKPAPHAQKTGAAITFFIGGTHVLLLQFPKESEV
jgi:hypothetical protein